MEAVAGSAASWRGRGVHCPMAFPLAGCAQGGGAGSAGTLTVYSGQHVQTTQALVAAFERDTGISVSLRSDDEDVLADQFVTEGNRSPADVFYTENSPPLQYLASKGMLATVDPATLHNTPSRLNSPDGRWVGVSGPGERDGLQHQAPGARDLPTSAMELADPRWSGRDRHRRKRDRLPAHRHERGSDVRRERGTHVANALKANAGGHDYPSNEALTQQ